MNKQLFFPKASDVKPENTVVLRTLGLEDPERGFSRQGKNWQKHQVVRQDNFFLSILEAYESSGSINYCRQEDFIKINFWVGGKHTTILNGFVQHEHDRPEVFITAGPREMLKIDISGREARLASVAICLRRDFFPTHMGIECDQLPEPLRNTVEAAVPSYTFHRFLLSPDLLAATQAILAAPYSVRREPLYVQAKAIELMSLLINRMESHGRRKGLNEPRARRDSRVYDARDFLASHYSEHVTLTRLCREVGLNKMSLTSGFREIFGTSVHDYLQKIRMERAYALLQDDTHAISLIAEAVGYRHSCNFSTAFHAHFGCTPQSIRAERKKVST